MARKKSFDTAIDFPFRLVVRPLVSQTRVPKAPLSLPLSLSLPARTPPGIQKRRRAILYTWELYTKISSFARDIREARVQPGGKLTSAHKNRFDILPLRRPYSETKLDSGGSEIERERERERERELSTSRRMPRTHEFHSKTNDSRPVHPTHVRVRSGLSLHLSLPSRAFCHHELCWRRARNFVSTRRRFVVLWETIRFI